MRIARFRVDGGPVRVGLVEGDEVAELDDVPDDTDELLRRLAVDPGGLARASSSTRHRLADVDLEPPVRPRKYLAIGLNYADHAAEAGLDTPDVPTVFNKQATCVNGSGLAIERPRASSALDYEGELAFVVGRRCRHVPAERAHEVIAGYLVANDVSIRDWQMATPTITIGKSWDTHGPLGPWLTTADEVPDPHDLRIRTRVNDDVRQESSTKHLIFDCFALVAHLSTVCTLEPGDVVATGTPSGVGALMSPPAWLVPGDRVAIEIEGLGTLENHVVEERDDAPRIERFPGEPACAG